MLKYFTILIVFMISMEAFSQDQITVNSRFSGTVDFQNNLIAGDCQVIKDQSAGVIVFDLSDVPPGASIVDVNLVGFINSLSTPEGMNFIYDLPGDASEGATFTKATTGVAYSGDLLWVYGSMSATLNASAIAIIEANAGPGGVFSISYASFSSSAQEYQFIGSDNSVYGADLIITLAETGVGPKADFTADKSDIIVGETVTFTDMSTGDPTSWEYNFAVGIDSPQTSTEQNPLYVYNNVGTFNVSLKATNAQGSHTKIKSNFIRVYDVPKPNFGFSFLGETGVSFIDSTLNQPTSWNWTFGDGNTSDKQNPIHNFGETGLYTVSLVVDNIAGKDSTSKELAVGVSGVRNNSEGTFKVYPNPASNFLQIESNDAISKIQIIDLNGKKLYDSNYNNEYSTSLDVSNLTSGIYAVILYTRDNLVTKIISIAP
jgi:PKD repeat protein